MTRLAFDIYPPDYPVTTTRLQRLTNQEYQEGTTYLHGRPMGTGQLVVDKDQAFVTATNFAVGNYVIVRDLDISEVSDSLNVLGGFYLEEGDFTLVSDDPKVLRFSGRSTISVLERAIMGPESLSPSGGPHSIVDGYWRWGVDTYGGVMRRALFEANYQTPPGLPQIETLTVGVDNIWWDDNLDSNGVAWPTFNDEYRTQCGTNLLELYRELYGYGVQLEIDARTFDVYAFNPDGYGTDRTSATFAAGKVRFVEAVNIAADLTRSIHGRLRTTHLLVRTTDYPEGAWIASDDYTPGDPVYKRAYQTGDISGDPSLSTALESRAQRHMDLRRSGEDAVRIPLSKPGDDEASGVYTPGPNFATGPTVTTGHFWVGDLITLDTGAHTMDYANASKRVEAVEYVLREAGDWDVIVHLGPRAFLQNSSLPSLAGATSHTLPLELCRPGIPATVTTLYDRTWDEADYDGNSFVISSDFDVSHGGSRFVNIGSSTSTQGFPNVSPWGIDETIPVDPGDVVDVYLEAAKRDPGGTEAICSVRFRDSGGGNLATHVLKGDAWGNATWYALTGQYTAPANTTHMTIEFSAVLDGWYLDRVLITTAGTEGTVNDGHPDLVGTSVRAARCDHRHDVHRDREPTVNDDWATQGYKLGTIWAQLDNLEAPTQIVGTWMLVDTTTGAAVWAPFAGTTPSGVAASDVTYDNSTSGLTADDVQDAIDELAAGGAANALTNIDGEKHVVNTVAASGTTETLDLGDGNWHDVTLTDNCTFTFAGATNGVGCVLYLILRQDGTGSRTVTWPGSVSWPDGITPTLATGANELDIFIFRTTDGGTTWFGEQRGAGGASALDNLSDVTITSAATGDMLRYNGTAWVNTPGRWEVVVSGTAPPVAVSTPDDDDWVYAWVST